MAAPLYQAIRNFTKKEKVSFHMPGHKNGRGIPSFFAKSAFSVDTTELLGTDNLHAPEGAIAKAEQLAGEAFGSKRTFFCVNGATGALHAAILSAVGRGGKLIAGRSSHASVIAACMLYDIEAVFYEESFLDSFGIPAMPSYRTMIDVLDKHADAKAFLITSPNYYGICGDIGKAVQAVHRRNMALIVDEAHGTHFSFSPLLPKSAVRFGADYVVNSAHKTLCAPTQTAFLHLGSDLPDEKAVQYHLSLMETSSPSYLFLCAMDLAREKAQKNGKSAYSALIRNLIFFRHQLERKTKCKTLGGDQTGFANIHMLDPTRLVINFRAYETTAADISVQLAEEYGIYAEMADRENLVCLLTPENTIHDLQRLSHALIKICSALPERTQTPEPSVSTPALQTPEVKPSNAFSAPGILLPLAEAEGRISKRTVSIYPPNIPILLPGSRITPEIISYLQISLLNGLSVSGLEKGSLWVLQD